MRGYVLILFIMLAVGANAQQKASDKHKPQWCDKLLEPSNATFSYEIVSASARSVAIAEDKCFDKLVANAGLAAGVVITYDKTTERNTTQRYVNGEFTETIEIENNANTNLQSEEVQLYVKHIDQYWEINREGDYTLTVLYAKSNSNIPPLFDEVEVTTEYGISTLGQSFIPGWAQIYKGSGAKGGVIIGATVVGITGIVVCDNMRATYLKKMSEQPKHAAFYSAEADKWTMGRNVAIGMTAALYAYNIIDGIVAKGAKRVVLKRRGGNVQFGLQPAVMYNGAVGMRASVDF